MMKKINRGDLLFSFVVVTFVSIMIYRIIYENEVKENSFSTICKVYDVKLSRYAVHNIIFRYKYNGKLYTGTEQIEPDLVKNYMNNFYEIKVSVKNPERYIINLNQRIEDIDLIKNAGL